MLFCNWYWKSCQSKCNGYKWCITSIYFGMIVINESIIRISKIFCPTISLRMTYTIPPWFWVGIHLRSPYIDYNLWQSYMHCFCFMFRKAQLWISSTYQILDVRSPHVMCYCDLSDIIHFGSALALPWCCVGAALMQHWIGLGAVWCAIRLPITMRWISLGSWNANSKQTSAPDLLARSLRFKTEGSWCQCMPPGKCQAEEWWVGIVVSILGWGKSRGRWGRKGPGGSWCGKGELCSTESKALHQTSWPQTAVFFSELSQ